MKIPQFLNLTLKINKMKTIKTYEAVGHNMKQLGYDVVVKGKQRIIQFEGGFTYPFERNGRFTTDDPDEQAALESDKGLGRFYKLIETNTIGEAPKEVVKPPKNQAKKQEAVAISEPENETVVPETEKPDEEPVSPGAEVKSETENTQEEGETKEILGISTNTAAKEYLNTNFNINVAPLTNKALIIEAAAKLGIVFPELNK